MRTKLTDEQRQAIEKLGSEYDLEAIREGIADMEAGRMISLEELDRRMAVVLGIKPELEA